MKTSTKQLWTAIVAGACAFGAFAPSALAQAQPAHKEPKPAAPATQANPQAVTPAAPGKQEVKAAGAQVGQPAPAFTLTDTDGKTVNLADFKGKVVVLEWFNPECPVVLMHHEANKTFTNLHKEFKDKGVVFLAVNSGAPGKEGAGKDKNAAARTKFGMEYPVLLDESGTVGKSFGARTTPHVFIINKDGVLAYKGAIDDGSGGKVGTKNYAKMALNEVLAGQTVTTAETKPYGCSVKYAN